MVICLYCNSKDHSINDCTLDCELVNILHSELKPNFNELSLNILKKIATQIGVKTSLPKIQLSLIMRQCWIQYKNNREYRVTELEKEIKRLKINTSIEECPICMENINLCSSTLSCGHKFCTNCFVKTVLRKNSCPMCREKIVNDNEYINNSNNEEDNYETMPPLNVTPYPHPIHISDDVPIHDIGIVPFDDIQENRVWSWDSYSGGDLDEEIGRINTRVDTQVDTQENSGLDNDNGIGTLNALFDVEYFQD